MYKLASCKPTIYTAVVAYLARIKKCMTVLGNMPPESLSRFSSFIFFFFFFFNRPINIIQWTHIGLCMHTLIHSALKSLTAEPGSGQSLLRIVKTNKTIVYNVLNMPHIETRNICFLFVIGCF